MKIHRNLALAVIDGLKNVLLQGRQADDTVEGLLQNNKSWGARDRNFIASHIYGIIRYKRLYEFCVEQPLLNEKALWLALGTRLFAEDYTLPAWAEFEGIDAAHLRQRYEEAQGSRKIRESVPDWLDEMGEKQLNDKWEKELAALNLPARLSIRVNTLKTSKAIVEDLFKEAGIAFSGQGDAPDALVLASRKNFTNNRAYRNGLFEVQDVSSQLVAPMLEVEPGMNVIDGCAGAGGKTLHIAALMRDEGEILAIDVSQKKLDELQRRAIRAGCHIVVPKTAEELTRTLRTRLYNSADRILLDVPCSGLGVLRRKPDAKWTLTPGFIDGIVKTQAGILDEYAPMLKADGIMVYSTCSILPVENQEQVRAFIERQKGSYELLEEKIISAAETGFDGFYIAKMARVK
ncbi:MAG TPA: hypothetical protein VG603_05345 [Chitinophagales bacterium]|nr:hypothetical protein [Chitinophagales bacterium]